MSLVGVFLNHSSRDAQLAEQLVTAIESCFQVPNRALLCTSVVGHGIEPGAQISDYIKEALHTAKMVISLITPNSISDAWPLAELGAAWALEKALFPVLAGGLPFKQLPGPLAGVLTHRLDSEQGLHDLMDRIKSNTAWAERSGVERATAIKTLLAVTGIRWQHTFPPERLLVRKQVMERGQKLRWQDIEQAASEELYIWGWSVRNVVTPHSRNTFTQLARKGIRLNLMMLDPEVVAESSQLRFGPVCDWTEEHIVTDIRNSIATLREFVQALPSGDRKGIALRSTNWNMTWSGVAMDPKGLEGLLQVEFYHYNNPYGPPENHLEKRLNLILRKESPFFPGFWGWLSSMWSEAKQIALE